jgi:hypothetical protein
MKRRYTRYNLPNGMLLQIPVKSSKHRRKR